METYINYDANGTTMQDKTDILRWLHQHISFAAMLATEEVGQGVVHLQVFGPML